METDAWERIAQHVRARRLELHLTQADAAKLGGVSLPSWGQVENAKQESYSNLTLAGVCKALGWTADSIDLIKAGEEPALVNRGGRPASRDVAKMSEAELASLVVEAGEELQRRAGPRRPQEGRRRAQ